MAHIRTRVCFSYYRQILPDLSDRAAEIAGFVQRASPVNGLRCQAGWHGPPIGLDGQSSPSVNPTATSIGKGR